MKLPTAILGQVSPIALAVYCAFARFADFKSRQTNASLQTVANLLGIAQNTAKAALRELSTKGWITTRRRGQGKTALRTLQMDQKTTRLDRPNFAPESETVIENANSRPNDRLRCNLFPCPKNGAIFPSQQPEE